MCGAGADAGDAGDGAVLRRYYRERDYIASPEGIMKLLSVVLCVVLSVLLLSGGCGGALRAASAALELAAAAALAALVAARLLLLAPRAPWGCLLTELVVSAAAGALLLATGALGLALCAELHALDYVHGAVAMATAGLVTGSAVVTFVAVTRRWDAARAPGTPARAAAPPEQDV